MNVCFCNWGGRCGKERPAEEGAGRRQLHRRLEQGGNVLPSKLRFVWHHGWYHVIVRIVLDTASFVTAVRSSDGAAGEVVRMIFREELVPLMDLKLGLEYRDVALRSEHVRASALSKREILELIEAVEAFAEPVEIVMKPRPLSQDPSDDMVLDVAINGRAEALVTSNAKHFVGPGKKFGIPVLSPVELLEKLREGNQDGD
jgi:putative PIN family toxin of toxin-antitoxin system